MTSVRCEGLQVGAGFNVRLGACADDQGDLYVDIGVSVGKGAGLFVFKDVQAAQRSSIDPEVRLQGGLGLAGSVSNLGLESGFGVGLGATIGLRGLVPVPRAGVNTRPRN